MKRMVIVLLSVLGLSFAAAGSLGAEEIVTLHGWLNLNTATVEQLEMLPGVNADMALNIVEFRDTNGPYFEMEELIKVKGITYSTIDNMRRHVRLSGPTTLETRKRIISNR